MKKIMGRVERSGERKYREAGKEKKRNLERDQEGVT